MIVYFDTSAIIPLIIAEPGTPRCQRLWNEADRVASSRVLYPEARAALAQARRLGRIDADQFGRAVTALNGILANLDHVEVTATLAGIAGELAQTHGLRGFDAIHLSSAHAIADDHLVFASGDRDQLRAASAIGLNTTDSAG